MNASFHKEFGYVIPDILGRKNVPQGNFSEVSFLFAWLLTEAKESPIQGKEGCPSNTAAKDLSVLSKELKYVPDNQWSSSLWSWQLEKI